MRRRWKVPAALWSVVGIVLVAGLVLNVSDAVDEFVHGYEPDCGSYSFDEEIWRASAASSSDIRERQAEALAECGVLEGLTGPEVRNLLGPPDRRGNKWRYQAGWVNDELGPGDEQTLYVSFGTNGRVAKARLGYPQ